ncbi:unnamed protein product [Notodromas monacha]|uniref:Uncharacterized protein n=1 Tax=Notodromas monacha TaxID=399045 RepID=A0A7R9GJE1_9CRUS|nr:unnamed protein product [Notodromas monacha]CAG0922749.1 unnamed protein product [Notodromas monacha]
MEYRGLVDWGLARPRTALAGGWTDRRLTTGGEMIGKASGAVSSCSSTNRSMSSREDASKLLEAALLEMDGIIASTGRSDFDDPGPPPSPILSISEAMERLKIAIQQQHIMCDNGNDETDDQLSDFDLEERNNNHNGNDERAFIDPETHQLILRWLTGHGRPWFSSKRDVGMRLGTSLPMDSFRSWCEATYVF